MDSGQGMTLFEFSCWMLPSCLKVRGGVVGWLVGGGGGGP